MRPRTLSAARQRRAAVAERLEHGDAPDVAEMHAQTRLGSPSDLARDLARPEQSTWRLLAAVGAGVRVGVGQWIYGFLLGWLTLLLGIYGLAGAVQLADRLFATGWTFQFTDQGWNTLITSGAFAVGLYFAGRAVPRAVSIASRRPVGRAPAVGRDHRNGSHLRPLLLRHRDAAELGTAPSVWPLVPLAFGLGAYRPHLLPGHVRSWVLVLVGALVLVPLVGLLIAGADTDGGSGAIDDESSDRGLGMVGPWWVAPMTADEPVLWNIRLGDPRGAGEPYEWELNGDAALAGLRDLRVEAWHVDIATIPRLDPGHSEPFATAPIERDGRTLTALLDTSSTPGTDAWELVVTGVGDDGTRYILDAGTILNSTFHGSAWDWLLAVGAIR